MNAFLTSDNLKSYLIALSVFLVFDMVWLLLIAKSLYSRYLGYLMTPNVNFAAAFAFYLLFIGGLLYFVINPALAAESWEMALFAGMFFGLVTYATYDLTNLATIRDWPLLITCIDLVWGAFVSGTTALLSYLLIRRF